MNNNMQQQTTINIQEKANLIWAIADKLVGVYKPHEYGNVILPMCVIKRFEDTLAPTKQAVLDTNAKLDKDGIVVKKGFLETAAGQQFYNLSPFTFQSLLNDPENIKENFESYLNHFSENVIDIIHRMDFDRELQKMADNNVLYLVMIFPLDQTKGVNENEQKGTHRCNRRKGQHFQEGGRRGS